jgi:cytidine deaminase
VTDPSDEQLIRSAMETAKNSYSPYSRIRVGAAILTTEGKIITGTNVENSSYGLSMCAERVAVFAAISMGYKNFKKIAVVTAEGKGISPCGACRQVLHEFDSDIEVLTLDERGKLLKSSLRELLPRAFSLR